MEYQISALDEQAFAHLFGADDNELARHSAVRMTVDVHPGYPCRTTLADAEVGEQVLLVNYEHLPVASPYRSTHAVFVREGAKTVVPFVNEVPESLQLRLLSVRGFDCYGMMVNADVVKGSALEEVIEKMFADPGIDFLHIHNAKPGCYAARVDRL